MVEMIEDKFTGPMVWDADTQFLNDGVASLDATCQSEISVIAQLLRDNPLPTEALMPADFDMPACTAVMEGVRETVDNGTGFAVVDRLDVDGLGREISTKIYWLLMSIAGRPVAQKWDGTRSMMCTIQEGKPHQAVAFVLQRQMVGRVFITTMHSIYRQILFRCSAYGRQKKAELVGS